MRSAILAIVVVGQVICGCYVYTPPPQATVQYSTGGTVYAQPAQTAVVQPAQPTVYAQPAQPVQVQQQAACVCRQGAMEICNGCDDNCNGIVDEECR